VEAVAIVRHVGIMAMATAPGEGKKSSKMEGGETVEKTKTLKRDGRKKRKFAKSRRGFRKS